MMAPLFTLFSSLSPPILATASERPGAPDGTGAGLPFWVLLVATISGAFSTIMSLWTVWLQLKHYHRPRLQRFVVRILVMVPIYSVSSLISLYSLDAAFFVDAFRDIYEAFVIYCFFSLLVEYLGGERSLIITLHGRPPHPHPRPIRWLLPPMDASDPFTFLALKRGILQYVQLKPLLAVITCVLKATGTYNDGHLAKDSGYTYISIVYNLSVSLSLYCLALFWVATSADLQPFRPMPKFLCVKGLIFATFWQGFAVSVLVSTGWVKSDHIESEQLSIAIQDTLIALELPLFAFLHLYAFSWTDYVDTNHLYAGRLKLWDATKDAFGYKDLILDAKATAGGKGFSYKTFEPASGALHSEGLVRDRRIAAGLRYSTNGKKYWLNSPTVGPTGEAYTRQGLKAGLASRPIHEIHRRLERRVEVNEGYAPLSHDADVLHVDRPAEESGSPGEGRGHRWWEGGRDYDDLSDGESEPGSLEFRGPDDEPSDLEDKAEREEATERWKEEWEEMEGIYAEARELEYGDWSYPVVDASREAERRRLREEEDAFLHGRLRHFHMHRHSKKMSDKGKAKDPLLSSRPGQQHRSSYGALAERNPRRSPSPQESSSSRPRPAYPEPQHKPLHSDPATSADHPAPVGTQFLEGTKHVLGAILPFSLSRHNSSTSTTSSQAERDRLPPDAVDLVVQDLQAEEEEQIRQRRRGEPSGKTRVYRVVYQPPKSPETEMTKQEGEEVPNAVEGERAEVKDVVGTGKGGREAERDEDVVRVVVEEEERTAVQAGVDETSERAEDADNPWS